MLVSASCWWQYSCGLGCMITLYAALSFPKMFAAVSHHCRDQWTHEKIPPPRPTSAASATSRFIPQIAPTMWCILSSQQHAQFPGWLIEWEGGEAATNCLAPYCLVWINFGLSRLHGCADIARTWALLPPCPVNRLCHRLFYSIPCEAQCHCPLLDWGFSTLCHP